MLRGTMGCAVGQWRVSQISWAIARPDHPPTRQSSNEDVMRIGFIAFLVLFGLFFGAAELYPWLVEGAWSKPLMVGAGILLAIASNPMGRSPSPSQPIAPAKPSAEPQPVAPPTAASTPRSPSTLPQAGYPPHAATAPVRRAPHRATPASPPISFTIKKPTSNSRPPT